MSAEPECAMGDALSVADRLYAERFDRMPNHEPWRSRWCAVESLHAAALATNALYEACKLADARGAIERDYWRSMAAWMNGEAR